MAVLFADISESTRLYQKLGDTAARTIVSESLALITSVLERHQGLLGRRRGSRLGRG